jgi:outer membrane protein assembly factor BamB
LLYFTSQDGKLYCARIKHQAVIWRYDSKAQIETSPLVQNNKVIFGNIKGWVTALDAKNGTFVWQYKANEAVYSSPAGFNGRVFFGTNSKVLVCLDDETGNLLWRAPFKASIVTSPAIATNCIVVASTDGKVTTLK